MYIFDRQCSGPHTACSEWHAIFVFFIRVQHAQSYCQLPFTVSYDGKGQ